MAYKPRIMKDVKIKYNDEEYDNIIMFNRGNDYSSFSYLDSKGSGVNIYLKTGETFDIINAKGGE